MKTAALLTLCAAALLTGCAGSAKLMRDGKTYPAKFEAMGKTIEAEIDGEVFKGKYLLNNSVGFASGMAGTTFTTMNIVGRATQGRALLTSDKGGVLRCDFNVDGMNAIGSCQDGAGRMYDLVTTPQ